MLDFIFLKEPERLDSFVKNHPSSSGKFLQSWAWGEFQKSLERKIWRLGVLKEGQIVASSLLIQHQLPLGKNYLYAPRGPLVSEKIPPEDYQMVWENLIKEIKKIAQAEKSFFFRLEPPISSAQADFSREITQDILTKYKFKKTRDIQPHHTLILDIQRPVEDILKEMKSKTRYNIRLAQKRGVRVRESREAKDWSIFLALLKETAQRQKFNIHPDNYYLQMKDALNESGFIKLLVAEYQGEILAANLVSFFGPEATYLFGAMGQRRRNLMAPYLLYAKTILLAQKLGNTYYDFWGIVGERKVNHAWQGITRFKKGFGGRELKLLGAFDWPLNNFWYQLYCLARNLI